MRKTSIYLEVEVDRALGRRAAALGTTKAQLIREVLRGAAEGAFQVKPRARGVFAGPSDLSEHVNDHLAESGFGDP